jgi:hypothetical protein
MGALECDEAVEVSLSVAIRASSASSASSALIALIALSGLMLLIAADYTTARHAGILNCFHLVIAFTTHPPSS